VNWLLATPIWLRLFVLFALGAFVGAAAQRFANWLRFEPVVATPGSHRRRMLVVPLLTGLAFAGLYWWEVDQRGLVRAIAQAPAAPDVDWALHAQFSAHLILLVWMLVASLVDIAEHTIPDLVTVPGTLVGLALATICPISLLPVLAPRGGGGGAGFFVDFLTLGSPGAFPAMLGPKPETLSLAIALAIYWAWCLALLPARWRLRHGWGRAARLVAARIARDPITRVIAGLATVGSAGIVAVWWHGGNHWVGLLTSLVGLAVGAGMIWTVRIVGRWAMGREAMGFGDVILMAMIGAYLGWQAMPIVFFLAPVCGLVVGVVQWVRFRDNVLPYGPFLCLAAAAVVVAWWNIWALAAPYYALPGLVPVVLLLCLGLLGALLGLLKVIRGRLAD